MAVDGGDVFRMDYVQDVVQDEIGFLLNTKLFLHKCYTQTT